MKKIKRTLAGLLAAAILIQVVPVNALMLNAFAEEPASTQAQTDTSASSTAGSTAASSTDTENSQAESTSSSAPSSSSEESSSAPASSEGASEPASSEENAESTSSQGTSEAASSEQEQASSAASDSEEGEADPEAGEEGQDAAAAETGAERNLKLSAVNSTWKNDDTNIKVNSEKELAKLSHVKPETVQNLTIDLSGITGQINLTGYDNNNDKIENAIEFIGLGTAEYPFRGTITGAIQTYTSRAFFHVLSSKAKITGRDNSNWGFYWCGEGSAPMIADTYILEGSADAQEQTDGTNTENTTEFTLPVSVQVCGEGYNTQKTMGSLFGVVKATEGHKNDILKIGHIATYNATVSATSSTNAGLICGTLESGNITIASDYTLPDRYDVTASGSYNGADGQKLTSGNAGGLIGAMGAGTTLTVEGERTINAAVTAKNGNAGGLVGLMMDGAKIVTGGAQTSAEGETETQADSTNNITLQSQTITGGASAGGVVGDAADVDLDGATITVTSPTAKATGNASNVGGLIGHYKITKAKTGTENEKNAYQIPAGILLKAPTVSAGTSGNSGGYFGWLELANGDNPLSFTFGGTEESKKTVITPTHGNTGNTSENAYGGLAGKITSSAIANTVKIQNFTVTSKNSGTPKYYGGLVGELGAVGADGSPVYLETNNIEVSAGSPSVSGWFGGLVAILQNSSILNVSGSATVSTNGTISRGGGAVGCANEGSAVQLAGATDFTGVNYTKGSQYAGWMLGNNNSALIYAKGSGAENDSGWVYKRGNGSNINDIANYGQIIRLKAENAGNDAKGLSSKLIQIDESSHAIKLNQDKTVNWGGDNITLSSADDFALLSIAWNSRGCFSADSSFKNTNWGDLKGKTIQLNNDIDLTGTGILGLSRDTYSSGDSDTFAGSLDGGGHTLTLAIGEKFGSYQNKGDGRIYAVKNGNDICHGAQGIFAKTNGATVQNLTIAGIMNVSNASYDFMLGGISAIVTGKNTVESVTASETITVYYDNSKYAIAGGLFGRSDGATITLTDCKASANINISGGSGQDEKSDSRIMVGGVLGQGNNSNNAINTITIRDLTVGGSITANQTKVAYVGGVVGVFVGDGNKNTVANNIITVQKLAFDEFNLTADKASKVGGLLAGILAQTTVTIQPESNSGNTALTVKNATISASAKNASVGGLCYRASGKWTIGKNGIDLEQLSITAKKDLGLLVCHGETNNETVDGESKPFGALYLETTDYWDDSYKIVENGVKIGSTSNNGSLTGDLSGVFDEFVAYTTSVAYNTTSKISSSKNILEAVNNGVISIATQETDGERVGVDKNDSCTTYQNRTAYGKNHKTNGYSRYYYDLDKCLSEAQADQGHHNDSKIDTPQELMLWSVYLYAGENIKSYFQKNDDISKNPTISGIFDLKGYSFYPVYYSFSRLTIEDSSSFTFYNQEIETIENNHNKSTKGNTEGDHTQHYGMHCGLLYRFNSSGTLSVSGTTFAGSVGQLDSNSDAPTSGALISKAAFTNNKNFSSTLNLNNITLNGLIITGYNDKVKPSKEPPYAPLLINKIGNKGVLTLNDIKATGYSGVKAASSLIGQAGGNTDDVGIQLTFTNIQLPDKPANDTAGTGIFTRATLLDSFSYNDTKDTQSNATYNFYETDNLVTYGNEINNYNAQNSSHGTREFPDLQDCYYKSDTKVTTNGTDRDFSSYLPYVYHAYDGTSPANNCLYHEIRVNHSVSDIVSGCGTYSHPYKITSAKEMEILAEYMATGRAHDKWCVRITKDQNNYHTEGTADNETVYQWVAEGTGGSWKEAEYSAGKGGTAKKNATTVSNDLIRQYLLNAYYSIELDGKDITITDFKGFGSDYLNPFRGVITSTGSKKLILNGSSNPLVVYSYGSVVKDLSVSYEKNDDTGKTLDYQNSYTQLDKKYSEFHHTVLFGGVIGCVLGGDNIIDNVSVTVGSKYLTLADGKNQNREHLIPVGGYVGEVAGGGVIFRNMTDSAGKLSNAAFSGMAESDFGTEKYLYINPYVGRVLDGFAFYEMPVTANSGESTQAETNTHYLTELENTDKNYKINTLDGRACITVKDNTVTPQNAQGLLVLSAIVNSGAASDGSDKTNQCSSISYSTVEEKTEGSYKFGSGYGKVRNAAYDKIGTVPSDNNSIKDDQTAPNSDNLPYLITKYCSGNNSSAIFSLCNSSTIKYALVENRNYDMSPFGTGYQGIGGRYASNAIQRINKNADKITINSKAENIVPQLNGFNGNGATITLDMQVKEYADDDFHVQFGVGGVVNLLRMRDCTIQDLTIQGKESSTEMSGVKFQYYDSNGNTTTSATEKVGQDVNPDTGAFAGSNSGLSGSGTATFSNVTVQTMTVKSQKNAGGLVGSVFMRNGGNAFITGTNAKPTLVIKNCIYDKIQVTAPISAGGFVGNSTNCSRISLVVEKNSFTVGKNSAIGDANTEKAGGAFGYVQSPLNVNTGTNDQNATFKNATLQNVTVTAKKYAGGLIGQIGGSYYYKINQVVFEKAEEGTAAVTMKSTENIKYEGYAGGIVGSANGAKSGNDNPQIINCQVKSATITYSGSSNGGDSRAAGGIVGSVYNADGGVGTNVTGCTVRETPITSSSVVGGIVGIAKAHITVTNCTVQGKSNEEKTEFTGGTSVGGIVGHSNRGAIDVTIQQCSVSNMNLAADNWACGGLFGDVNGSHSMGTLYLFDSKVVDSSIREKAGSKNTTHVGGFAGNVRSWIGTGGLKASNLLLKGVRIHASKQEWIGMVLGCAENNKTQNIYVAGLSIQDTTATYDDINGIKKTSTSTCGNIEKFKGNSYFAFADSFGSALTADCKDENGNSTSTAGTEKDYATATSPYVVTSPKSALSVWDSENDNEAKYLYGDGAYWTSKTTDGKTTFTTNAKQIWDASQKSPSGSDKHYPYQKFKDSVTRFGENWISTYNANQNPDVKDEKGTVTEKHQLDSDFPVLQVEKGNAEVVQNYLDIVTNGGFSAANALNTTKAQHVKASATVYEYKNGKLVRSNATPAFTAKNDPATGQVVLTTTSDYDNTRDRFTLLTVTFTETDRDGKPYNYYVYVPIIVRRMLQVDFSATLSYGTNFREGDYTNLTSHVLESFGSTVTGYLKYTYNSENGKFTEYGWKSYIDAGGDVAQGMGKELRFANSNSAKFPEGTQFTLVDEKTGKAYYYTAPKEGCSKIEFTSFQESLDKNAKYFEETSIADLIGATAAPSSSGKFIQVDHDGKPTGQTDTQEKEYPKPTVKIGGSYYRLVQNGETGTHDITVAEGETSNQKSSYSESYFLVITVPSTENAKASAINGSLQTNLKVGVPKTIHYNLIQANKDGSLKPDNHSNTASTYLLSSGYRQKLQENQDSGSLLSGTTVKVITDSDRDLYVDVVDTITFPNGQAYLDGNSDQNSQKDEHSQKDELYLRIVGSLQNTIKETATTKTSSQTFPSGTSGTAEFYVYDNENHYYQWDSNKGWSQQESGNAAAVRYDWTSTGGNMELLLSEDGTADKLISLQGVRALVRGDKHDGDSTFHVRVKMTANIPASGIDVIPQSVLTDSQPDSYSKLVYTSQLSVTKESLAYSSNRATASNTNIKYYRKQTGAETLTYTADSIDMLGINPLDKNQTSYMKDGKNSIIDTTAKYDLTNLNNKLTTLKNSSGIQFTLTLQKKQQGKDSEYETVGNANDYMRVKLTSSGADQAEPKYDAQNGTWSWKVEKDAYFDSEKNALQETGVFDTNILTQNIQLLVDTVNVESLHHQYGNYKVVVTAEILGSEGNPAGQQSTDNLIYTLAKIRTEFVEQKSATTTN